MPHRMASFTSPAKSKRCLADNAPHTECKAWGLSVHLLHRHTEGPPLGQQSASTQTTLLPVRWGQGGEGGKGVLTQIPFPSHLLPERAVGRGCLRLDGTYTP